MSEERGRWVRRIAAAVVIALALGLAFWAGRVTMSPQTLPTEVSNEAVTVEVREASVGRSLLLNVTVGQAQAPAAVNSLQGVVTQAGTSGQFGLGDVLYTVNDTKVRVVAGSLPFFRDLATEATGQDVRQLNEALVGLGYLTVAGERFDWYTSEAVKAWQRDLGMPQTGMVRLGELVAVPNLPAALVLDDEVLIRATMLMGGEIIVFAPSGVPKFEMVLDSNQARLVSDEATTTIKYQGHSWPAVIESRQPNNSGAIVLTLNAPGGGSVCGEECGVIPPGKAVNIPSQIVVIPPVSGAAVPVTAILSNPDRTTKVIVVDGETRSDRLVKVLGSENGLAVVEGVEVGERVQVLAGKNTESATNPGSGTTGAPQTASLGGQGTGAQDSPDGAPSPS